MALSPFVLAAAVASAAVLVRRARLSPRVAAFEACLGLLACVTMAAFVVCYGVWITEKVRLEPGLPVGLSVGATNATIIALLAPGAGGGGAGGPDGRPRPAKGARLMAPTSRRRFLGYGLAGRGGRRGGRRRRRRAHQPRRPAGQGRARRDRRGVLGRRTRPGVLRPARPAGIRHVLLAGQEPRRRLHDRLPARPPAGLETAAGDHAARLRRQPRQRALRPVARPGARAPGRRRPAAPDGPGDGGRRHRLLEPAPGRQPAGDAHRRADPAVPAPRPGRSASRRRHGHLDGRLRRPAAGREAPRPDQRGRRDQPGHLDELRPGAGGQRRGVRVGGRLRGRRRGDPRRRARPRPGPHRGRLRRPVLPRRPGPRPRAAQAHRR